MPENRRAYLFAESVAYVFQDPVGSLLTNMSCGVLMCALLLPAVPGRILLYWLIALLVATLFRVMLSRRYYRAGGRPVRFWYRAYAAGTLVSAMVWGASALLFFTGETEFQIYLVAVLAGVVAGAGHSQAPFARIYCAYTAVVISPVAFQFLLKGKAQYFSYSAALLFLIVALVANSRRIHRILIASIHLRYDMRKMAITDGLTMLFNRRHFDDMLEKEWKRALRRKSEISLLMIDVDHFKRYNDIYGHPSGDECLRRLSEVIRSCIHRPADLAARYGGEEFAVILPETPCAGAKTVAEHVRRQIQDLHIPHRENPAEEVITVSVGISTRIPSSGKGPESLVRTADEALYEAKRLGRNRVVIESPEIAPACKN